MKVLLVGSDAPGALEHYYVEEFRALGVESRIFSWASHYMAGSLVVRVLARLGAQSIYQYGNDALLAVCRSERPDIVWVFKGSELYIRTLVTLRTEGFVIANYNPDHPFIRTSVSHGTRNMERSLPLYDIHFCYGKELVRKLTDEWHLKAVELPFAYKETDVHRQPLRREDELCRLALVGNPDRTRGNVVRQLLRLGFEVDVFGHNWSKYLIASGSCRIHGPVFEEAYWSTLQKYRVQLNVFRPHNVGSHNMRTFEVPSVGGLLLTPYSIEQASYFQVDQEIFLYRNFQDLVEKATYLTSLSFDEANDFRRKARQRCLVGGYDYSHRARFVLDAFQSLVEGRC